MKLMIFLLMGFVFLPAFAQEPPSIHFHGDVQAWSSNSDNIFEQGDSILLSGWSGAYQDWGGVFVTPDSEFQITILDPDGLDFFKESIISDSQGNMEHVVALPADAKVGRYQIFVEISSDEYGKFGADHRLLHVSPPPPPPKDHSIKQDYEINILSFEPAAQFGDFGSIPWTVCPQIDVSTLKEFSDAQTGIIVKEGQALIIYKTVSPSGIVVEEPNDYPVKCGDEYSAGFHAIEPGIWTVDIMLRWYDGQSVREISGDTTEITVSEPVFSGSEIESISAHVENLEGLTLLDWSPDGERIAVLYVLKGDHPKTSFLGLMDADGQNAVELWETGAGERVGTAKFSPDERYLFAIAEDRLMRYSMDTSEMQVMYDEEYPIMHFDFLPSDAGDFNLIASLHNESWSEENPTDSDPYSLVSLGPPDSLVSDVRDGEIMVHGFEKSYFDFNSDGSRILFVRTLDSGYGLADRTLTYLDTKGTVYELGRDPGCGRSPVWSPGDTLIIYENASCGRGPPGSSLYITSDDGSFFEVLLPYNNYGRTTFIVSPDGQYIMYPTEGPGNFLKMKFAKSVPEFGVLGILIAAISIIAVIAVSRAKPGRLYS